MSDTSRNFGEAFLYGIDGTITGCAVQSVQRKRSFVNTAEVVNEQGNRITKRYDDLDTAITIELIPKATGFTEPVAGTKLTYKSVNYIVESVDDKQEAKGFVRFTLSCLKPEYINPT
jgi:hypothetical protein